MPKTSLDVSQKLWHKAKVRNDDPKEVWGIPWGIRGLDRLLGGIHAEQYAVVGAVPGIGKTAFLCQVAVNVGTHIKNNLEGKCIRIISTEMSAESLQQRMALYVDALEVERLRKEDPTRVIKNLTQRQFDTGFASEKEMQR